MVCGTGRVVDGECGGRATGALYLYEHRVHRVQAAELRRGLAEQHLRPQALHHEAQRVLGGAGEPLQELAHSAQLLECEPIAISSQSSPHVSLTLRLGLRGGGYGGSTCFKCGAAGHWSRDCPGRGGGGFSTGCDSRTCEPPPASTLLVSPAIHVTNVGAPTISSTDDYFMLQQLSKTPVSARRLLLDTSDQGEIRVRWNGISSTLRGHLHGSNAYIHYSPECLLVRDETRQLSYAPLTWARYNLLDALLTHCNRLGVAVAADLSPLKYTLELRDHIHSYSDAKLTLLTGGGLIWLLPSTAVSAICQSGLGNFSLRPVPNQESRCLAATLSSTNIEYVLTVGSVYILHVDGADAARAALLLEASFSPPPRPPVTLRPPTEQMQHPPPSTVPPPTAPSRLPAQPTPPRTRTPLHPPQHRPPPSPAVRPSFVVPAAEAPAPTESVPPARSLPVLPAHGDVSEQAWRWGTRQSQQGRSRSEAATAKRAAKRQQHLAAKHAAAPASTAADATVIAHTAAPTAASTAEPTPEPVAATTTTACSASAARHDTTPTADVANPTVSLAADPTTSTDAELLAAKAEAAQLREQLQLARRSQGRNRFVAEKRGIQKGKQQMKVARENKRKLNKSQKRALSRDGRRQKNARASAHGGKGSGKGDGKGGGQHSPSDGRGSKGSGKGDSKGGGGKGDYKGKGRGMGKGFGGR